MLSFRTETASAARAMASATWRGPGHGGLAELTFPYPA